MRAIWFAIVAAVGALMMTAAAGGQESAQMPESAFLQEMFSDAPLNKERFADVLLKQVPYEQLKAIVDQLKAVIGPLVMVQAKGGTDFMVVTKTHELPVVLVLDGEHRISGILFRPPLALSATVDEMLTKLGPDTAYLILKNGEVVHQNRADEALAVGSAFKLAVLAALKDEIDAGKRKWEDVVRLDPANKSLPTGILQDFPDNAPLTLHTLAALMIEISDNTAADTLLRTVGREAVEAKLGAPVITTRELFVLKADAALRARYTKGDAKAALADADKAPLPGVNDITGTHQQGVEWYVPLTRLCALIAEVGGLDVMHINPGLADHNDWTQAAFKGGSEAGVLNFTTQVTNKTGDVYCVAATWNAPSGPVDEGAATGAYASLLKTLAKNP